MKKNWKWILLVVVIIGAVGAWYGMKQYNRKPKGAGELKAAFEMPATDLTKAFSDDETGSNTKFNGKPILISGTVREVGKEGSIYTITIAGDGDMSNVVCSMGETETGLDAVKAGDAVKIQGFCTGAQTMLGVDVQMNRCAIIK